MSPQEKKIILKKAITKFKGLDKNQLSKGVDVEMEHSSENQKDTDVIGSDKFKAAKIAVAHLREIPDYYDRLEKMENNAGVK